MEPIARRSILALAMLMSITPSVVISAPGPRAEWKAFVSRSLQVALDYPSDWSATESPPGAMFTSPKGVTIRLGVVDTGVLSPEEFQRESQLPHARCASRTNRHGITVRNCFDTVSFVQSAEFIVSPGRGAPRLLSLVMRGRGDLEVFNGMTESLRLAW